MNNNDKQVNNFYIFINNINVISPSSQTKSSKIKNIIMNLAIKLRDLLNAIFF
jgi:LytS/YehU family sensor histidine kinase